MIGLKCFEQLTDIVSEKKSDAECMPDEIGCNENDAEKMPEELKLDMPISEINGEKTELESPESKTNIYSDLESMKQNLNMTYGEIKANKPLNSPNIAKWFNNGGSLKVEQIEDKPVWTYIDKNWKEISYVDGYPVFPLESKHPVIADIDIGKFTGDRNEDKKLYLKKLEEQYGLMEIPDGYFLHHDVKDGNMQLVKEEWHKEFTHKGGYSIFKEV